MNNPYYELKLKLLRKEISQELYQKSFKLLQELEQRDLEKKASQSTTPSIIPNSKINRPLNSKNKKQFIQRQIELEKKRIKDLEIKKAREERYQKVRENLELLQNPSIAKQRQKEYLHKLSQMNPLEKLKALSQLEIVKEFSNEHNYSKNVVLLENLIVRKQCQLDSFGNYMFKNEIKSLQKVSFYPHFPILVAFDPYNLIIYMTYCGTTLNPSNIPDDWKDQFEEIAQILEVLEVNSNDMLLRNTCIFDGEISIIDFGLDTQFGRDLKSVLREFYQKLASISHQTRKDYLKVDQSYQKDYLGWKERLQKTRDLKKYLELEMANLRNKGKKWPK